MKNLSPLATFFCLFLLSNFHLRAQEFAPIGATWCYHGDIKYFGNFSGPANSWTDNLVVEGDTVVAGIECRRIVAHRDERNASHELIKNSIVQEFYVYDNTDTAFIYNDSMEAFIPLYVFSASEQDTICLPVPQPAYTVGITTYCFVIDSIRLEDFGGVSLRSFYTRVVYDELDDVSVNFGHYFHGSNGSYNKGRYTEQIGGSWPLLSGLFPIACNRSPHMQIKSGFPNGELSSYSSATTSISLNTLSCDSVMIPLSLAERQREDVRLALFPNPASQVVHLQLSEAPSSTGTIRIIDLLGREHLSLELPKGQREIKISLSQISPGLYIVESTFPFGKLTHKLLINHL